METLKVEQITSDKQELIEVIAKWYYDEWKIPTERTIARLQNQSSDDILFQLILKKSNIPVATGGLYNNIGLHQAYPEFKKLKPWVALLYTEKHYRNMGIGSNLLKAIEETARELQLQKIYLYTFTAEELYRKKGWQEIARVDYHGQDTVVMEKSL